MFSVFSNIKQFEKLKPSEKILQLSMDYGSEYNRFILAGPEDEPLYMLKPKAIDVLVWINRKIVYQLPNIDMRTVYVRIRIATGMMNNLEKEGILPKDILITYHNRLTTRIRKILGEIWTEDLPF